MNPSCPYCYHSNKSSGGKNPLAIILPLICVLVVVVLVGGAIFMNPEIVDFTKRVIDSNVSGETSNSNTSKQNNKQKQQNKTDNQITQAVEPTKTPIEEYKTQEEFLKVTETLPITCSSNLPDGTMISQCIVKSVKYAKLSSGIELSMDIEKTYDYFGTQPCFVGLYIKDKSGVTVYAGTLYTEAMNVGQTILDSKWQISIPYMEILAPFDLIITDTTFEDDNKVDNANAYTNIHN